MCATRSVHSSPGRPGSALSRLTRPVRPPVSSVGRSATSAATGGQWSATPSGRVLVGAIAALLAWAGTPFLSPRADGLAAQEEAAAGQTPDTVVEGAEAEPRPMTTDDGLDMVRVGGAMISPDGELVFYSRSELEWDENERETTYWMVEADGGEPWRFIGEEGGSGFQFSPEGTYLSFRREVDDEQQIHLMPLRGGEGVQLTEHESSVKSYVWADDESRVFFLADEPRTEEEEAARKKGEDAIYVDEGPHGQREGRWENLWVYDLESEKEERLTEVDHQIGSFDVSPDGGRVVFTARFENRRNQGNLSEIFLLDVESGEIEQLTDNAAPEGSLQWAPDGVRIGYTAPDDEAWELRNNKLWVMDVDTREHRMVSGAFEGNLRGWAWSPEGDAVLFTGLQRTNSNVYRLDVESGEVERLTDAVGTLAASDFSKDRARMVYSFEDHDTPEDLYVAAPDGTGRVRLTEANPWVEETIELADMEVVEWESYDGTPVEGLLWLPDGHDRSRPLPLLLHIHGGPAGVFTNGFRSSAHVWAGLGYAQLMPNVRGSSGYDDELLRGNMYDIGGGDYEDLMSGVDWTVEAGIADAEHLALRGWSYGGILGGWTITQTDRFDAASLGAMVADWTSEYGPGFNYDVRLWYIGGTPWDNADEWRLRSALTHVADVETPTILFHGMNDRTDTESQSMMFFKALQDLGVETRYLRFPREPHGFREPRHQRIRDIEEIRWIQKHARGIDWEPWERPEEEEEDGEGEASVTDEGGGAV